MNLSLYIAKRYLFSKKSQNAINVISIISVVGIALAASALICTLSVFNGFTEVVTQSFSAFDPQLQVTPTQGKVFALDDAKMEKLKAIDGIAFISESLEENALLKFEDRQEPILLKGVSPKFREQASIDSLIIDGQFSLREGDIDYGVIGAGLAMLVGTRAGFQTPAEIFMPKRNVKVQLANPSSAFTPANIYIDGVFASNQQKYDDLLLIVSIDLVRELLDYQKEVTSLDIKVKDNYTVSTVKNEIATILGSDYKIKDRFEQQDEIYRMVNVEKWVTFLILILISTIAIFNVVGSLSMLILEKTADIEILKSLGASKGLITKIFLFEGWLITFIGCTVGLTIGVIICFVQQYFGILKLGSGGSFIIDAYPVLVELGDLFLTFFSVTFVGFLAVLYPINVLRKRI